MILALLAAAAISVADRAAEELHFHGVVRIERGDEREQRGYGLSPATAFWVASISKSFTAVLVARLAELGKLRLEDRVLDSDLTFDELLTHTSGLPRTTYIAEGIAGAADAARKILALPRGPKGKFAYTSDGYTLLAIAAEKAGGAPFFELLQPRDRGLRSQRGGEAAGQRRGAGGALGRASDQARRRGAEPCPGRSSRAQAVFALTCLSNAEVHASTICCRS